MHVDKAKILVIDDDQDVRRGLGIRLRANNYKVGFAEDAVTALMAIRREEPDLVILDLGLPGGGGFGVLEKLENLPAFSGVPVIVLTAREPDEAQERALASGAYAFFQKPADNDELLAAIDRALGGSS